MTFAATLPDQAPDLWEQVTKHAFVEAVGSGTLPVEAFNASMREHYTLVRALGDCVRSLQAQATGANRGVLRAAASVLEPEYALFRRHAEQSAIDLTVAPSKECTDYATFLTTACARDYGRGLVAFYGCERALNEAWLFALTHSTPSSPYAAWLGQWSSNEFAWFVQWIGERVDEAVGDGSDELRELFVQGVRHLIALWNTCWSPED